MSQPPEYKDPDATNLLALDWSDWLKKKGNTTISTSAWSAFKEVADARVATSEITLSGSANDTVTTNVRVAGGLLGASYFATNKITTVSGLVEEQSIKILMIEK